MEAKTQLLLIDEMLLKPYTYKNHKIPRLPLIKEIDLDYMLYQSQSNPAAIAPAIKQAFTFSDDVDQQTLVACFLFWQHESQSFIRNPDLIPIFGRPEKKKDDEKQELKPIDHLARHFLYEKVIRIYGFEAVQKHNTNYLSFLLRIHESEKAVDNLSLRDLLFTIYVEANSGKINKDYTKHLIDRASGILFEDKKIIDDQYRKRVDMAAKVRAEYWNSPEFRGLTDIKKAAFIKRKVNERMGK